MSGYKNFAIAGAGNIGKLIVDELVKKRNDGSISSITLLTRSTSGHDDLVAKGIKLAVVDYANPASLEVALAGIDVVISTVGGPALDLQEASAKAAKNAGVKLFVPSEFGGVTDGATQSIFKKKDGIKALLRALDLPYAAFYNGPFPDFVFRTGFSEPFGFDFINGKASIAGSGASKVSFTTMGDVARFVAYALTALPKEKIEWHNFRIEGDRTSFNQIAADWNARSNKPLTVTHFPRSVLEEALSKNPEDFISFLRLELDEGEVGMPDELSNSEWPEWKPKKAIDAILEIYGQ